MIIPAFLKGLIWSLLLIAIGAYNNSGIQPGEVQPRPNHLLWEEVLTKYVDDSGNVNYKVLASAPGPLLGYLDHMSENPPASTWTRADSLAYYINLYNAATVKLIIDNYPVNSIKDITNPWLKKRVLIGDKKVSLAHIENKILRKMDEPRIHFAINCASFSCPKLINTAFTADKIEAQLASVTKDFIADTTRNNISSNKLELSKIFQWYKGDFKSSGGLRIFINENSPVDIEKDAEIIFLKYDWSLNEAR
ncbi:MAG: DUF547 domain-containing protein [Bacteroidia bacterium]|nr:DUF547 domain-containing protein [Bacteroidia bacterium]